MLTQNSHGFALSGRFRVQTALALVVFAISGCGGGGGGDGDGTPIPSSFTVGGTVANLGGSGLTLASGSHTAQPEPGDGSFTLSGTFAPGETYSVSVTSVPAGQACTVTSGSGTVESSNVTTVQVSCANTHIIEGSISGLNVNGLILANGTETLSIPSGGTFFSFSTPLPDGSKYSVSVRSQPSQLTCVVTNGSGVINGGSPSNIAVVCRHWLWVAGPDTPNAGGVYGTQGVAAQGNTPGARAAGGSWTDAAGNFWLFGGSGYDVYGIQKSGLSDLWKRDWATGFWTWVSGPSEGSLAGVYGTLGVPDVANFPGARTNPVTWIDKQGNLWLFGGTGLDGIGSPGDLNDLWKFDPLANQWTWVAGSNLANALGTYGMLGVPSSLNVPGARDSAVAWADGDGNLWLFGGNGEIPPGVTGALNDLWKYSPSTGVWTWMAGSSTGNASGVYGMLGVPATSNAPGARYSSASWADDTGTFWLFGGYGFGANSGFVGDLNDVWSYTPSTGQWTWISGSSAVGSKGTYGTRGIPASGSAPGSRINSVAWYTKSGVWLFGGVGNDSAGAYGGLNDLWRFDPTTDLWTWTDGSNTVNAAGVYGTQGMIGNGNTPGARYAPFYWQDVSTDQNLWLFGGYGVVTSPSYYNDLWVYID